MSTTLRPIPIHRMLEHIARELEMSFCVFSVPPGFRGSGRRAVLPFGSPELPLGVAGGPHTAMAQNLAAAYVAGSRVFGLRTDRLPLEVALGEYVKGSFVIQLLSRELGLGGAAFALVLPGDRARLEEEEMAAFLTAAADATQTPLWEECRQAALAALGRFNNLDQRDIAALDPCLSRLAVLEWEEPGSMEEAALHLLEDRGFCVYIRLSSSAPAEELAAPVERLRRRGEELGLSFGLSILAGGPGDLPAALELCARCARLWPGLPMAWAGGVDCFNVRALRELGAGPVLAEDTLYQPGGYLRLRQIAKAIADVDAPDCVDPDRAEALAASLGQGDRPASPERRRIPGKAPLLDCFTAPCQAGCPFGEDITGALRLMSDGRYRDALRVILDKNPLPHITGALCPQPCGGSCTRLFYDQPIQVRRAEALCAQRAWEDLLPRLEPAPPLVGRRVAVVGSGPAGLAASILLARRGVPVSLLEAAPQLCPALRGQGLGELVDRDAQLLEIMEVDIRLSAPVPDPAGLLKTGYSHVVLAPEGEGTDLGEDAPADRVFILGPGLDVAQAIAAAHSVADSLLGPAQPYPHPAGRRGGAMGKKGKLRLAGAAEEECERCLECATVCECCVDVCPNRANVPITVLTQARPQILHLDGLCDHCGVCARSCPYESAPDRDKFTLFETLEDFEESENAGFVVMDFLSRKVRLRLEGEVRDASLRHVDRSIPAPIQELMETIFTDYPYLLDPGRA